MEKRIICELWLRIMKNKTDVESRMTTACFYVLDPYVCCKTYPPEIIFQIDIYNASWLPADPRFDLLSPQYSIDGKTLGRGYGIHQVALSLL